MEWKTEWNSQRTQLEASTVLRVTPMHGTVASHQLPNSRGVRVSERTPI